jgi:UDP-N-acetylglucosamine pyrophosphorylase
MSLAIIIMAAGKGTRMKSDLAKVLHPLGGRPMLHEVLDTSQKLSPEKIVIIVGHQADSVKEATAGYAVSYALQSPQLGTGHAVMQAEPFLEDFTGDVIVLSGDVPLTKPETLRELIKTHHDRRATATVLTAILADPTGYGRVIRGEMFDVIKIVEHKDATEKERQITEINSGIYVFDAKKLFAALKLIRNDNAQNEYYLPDVFKLFFHDGERIAAMTAKNFNEIRGINTPEQLKEAEDVLLSSRADNAAVSP